MANVNWINGTITPPESGEYYVILEATEAWNSEEPEGRNWNPGEIEMTGDWYDTEEGYFQSLGKDNPFWKVLSWASVLRPSIPEDIRPKVKRYFGTEVNRNG